MDGARQDDSPTRQGEHKTSDENADESFDAEIVELDAQTPRIIRDIWTAQPLAGGGFTLRQRLWRGGSAVGIVTLVCILLLAGTYAGALHRLFETPPPQPVTLPVSQDGLECITDIAWSPDSRQIAVAGYANNGCGAEMYATPLLLIYDARTHRLLRRISPDASLLPALHALLPELPLPGSARGSPFNLLLYENALLWSPDGKRLGMIFLAVAYPATSWTSITGLFVASADGSRPATYLHLLDPAVAVSSGEWNVASGAILASPAIATAGPRQTIPPALAYTWGTSGDLAPQDPLAINVVPPAPLARPVGSPTRDVAFTVWQPGAVISVAQWNDARYSESYEWNTRFAAWSPDGQYIISLIHVLASLSLDGDTQSGADMLASAPDGGSTEAILPVRDAALMALLLAAPPQSAAGEWEVAWRPDGRELAAFRLSNEPAHTAGIYDCASGRRLLSLPLASASDETFVAGSSALVRWSPDGSRLLLFSPELGAITVLGPKDLGTH